jgi:crotonobetainyl-CoA:carnitine CoA-transferase CaiB-like acyl-CoA transferase
MSELPLAGVRVLDFSKVLAGPMCAQYLGDMGAGVVKIESTGLGDDTRYMPPFRGEADARVGAIFLSANRNKRSVAIDMGSAPGRDIIYRLVKEADITISSFGPGVAQKLGLDADTLRDRNPRLICCEISGFGSVGPMRLGKGYDVILQAFTGMLSMTGEPGGPPVRSPFSPVDQATGLHAMGGILAALYKRGRTGQGSTVEASLFDTAAGFLSSALQNYWERGTEPAKAGSGHESLCPYQVFGTQDKPLILGIANDALWRKFCALAALDHLRDDPRFRTNADRVCNRDETVAVVAAVLAGKPRDVWLPLLDAAGIPVSAVNTLGEMSGHAHTRQSGMKFDYQHPALGALHGVALPLRVDGERAALRRPPPLHGEHSAEVLAEFGFSEAQIKALADAGTIGLTPSN